MFLSERHYGLSGLESLKVKLGMCGLIVMDSIGRSGGLALFWNLTSGVNVLGFSKRFIDVEVSVDGLGS